LDLVVNSGKNILVWAWVFFAMRFTGTEDVQLTIARFCLYKWRRLSDAVSSFRQTVSDR
jgi:hypothetical protein